MSKHKILTECKKSDDFIKYAEQHGAKIRNGHGSHVVVCTDKGSCALPHHGNSELGTGLCRKVMKIFAIIGLAILIYIVCVL